MHKLLKKNAKETLEAILSIPSAFQLDKRVQSQNWLCGLKTRNDLDDAIILNFLLRRATTCSSLDNTTAKVTGSLCHCCNGTSEASVHNKILQYHKTL